MEQIPNPRCGSVGCGYVLSLGYSERKWMVQQRVATAQKKLWISEIPSQKYDKEVILPLHRYQSTLTSTLRTHVVPFPPAHGYLPVL